ncbi:MAG: Flp/Fap pilin component [Rhodospirillales bacterium]|jgi:pilus assembly protein Flp/PilA|nr:Flp/Fap pilin component [Rhodospirillales bacterium]
MREPKSHRAWTSLIGFMRAEDGITAIEYGLVAALISVFIMVAIGAVGEAVVDLFELTAGSFPG